MKEYILAHRYDACDAALGRRHYKVKATTKAKRKTKSNSKTVAPVAPVVTAITPAFDLLTPLTEHLDVEFSTM